MSCRVNNSCFCVFLKATAEAALNALHNSVLVGAPTLAEEVQGADVQAAAAGNGIFMGM
jgi:hypothetical protein